MTQTGTTAAEAKKWVGYRVRVRGHGDSWHGKPAILKSVNEANGTAVVRPPGHGQDEVVKLGRIALWKSRAPEHLRGGIGTERFNEGAVRLSLGATRAIDSTTTPLDTKHWQPENPERFLKPKHVPAPLFNRSALDGPLATLEAGLAAMRGQIQRLKAVMA